MFFTVGLGAVVVAGGTWVPAEPLRGATVATVRRGGLVVVVGGTVLVVVGGIVLVLVLVLGIVGAELAGIDSRERRPRDALSTDDLSRTSVNENGLVVVACWVECNREGRSWATPTRAQHPIRLRAMRFVKFQS